MPPFELRKNLAYGKNATKMRHFQAKISKIFWGGGTAPSPDPTPTEEGNTPDQTPHPRRCSPQTPPNFFPISIITLDSDAVIDEFGKSNRTVVLLVDLDLLNGTRLEVGPVDIQSSH